VAGGERLGIGGDAAALAEAAGLLEVGARVRFRHPLVRSAAYRAASARDRQEVHRALAEVTDPQSDPDGRAWHRASVAFGPDEAVAAELEHSAERAQARGGVAGAAAFLQRATELTPDPARRGARALAAAQANLDARAPDTASELLAVAELGPLEELQRARRLRAQIAFARRRGRDAPPLLLTAAARLAPLDAGLARETYLEALEAATFAGHLDRGTAAAGRRPAARWPGDAVHPGLPAAVPAAAGCGWRAAPLRTYGTTRPTRSWPPARSGTPARPARSQSFLSRSPTSPACTCTPASSPPQRRCSPRRRRSTR
jgi:hypothetical protein